MRIVDQLGQPASGVTVTLYQRNGPANWLGHITIDNTPEIMGVTTADGSVLLSNRSANGGTTTASGHVLHDNPFGVIDIIGVQNRFLVRLGRGEHEEFHWLDITEFNLAYWSGETLSHTFTITSHVPVAAAPPSPAVTTFQVEANHVHLCWQAVPGAAGYRVYRAGAPDFRYQPISGLITGACFDDDAPYSYSGNVYVVTARDGLGRESGFSHFRWTPILIQPAAAVIRPDGNTVLLDPQNGNALIGQDEHGRYLQNYGAPYHYLAYARFMALDANQRLLFNHPGDPYSSRHSVMIYDLQGTPLLEFGETGSGPGQFQNPAGVASWGPACTYGGPYTDDAHTLLLAHFDGSINGTQGEAGTANGVTLMAGRYNQGVVVDASDTLTYTATGNLTRTQGAVEFWLRPNWNGNDYQNYVFFEAGNLYTWENRLRIAKDGANNLRFLLWDGSGTEYGAAYNVSHWQAGEWHHIAATWGGGRIVLYVDGQPVSQASNIQPPAVLPPAIFVGASAWLDLQANAVIDELRISAVPRLGNSLVCNRLLVADSGNQRLQVFDSLGNFVSGFGSPGSGPGQFDTPQGLTVDRSGRVIVVDSGNHRLQVLSFDGETLSFSRVITADFNLPIGVAADSANRLVVADTGHNLIKVLDPTGPLLAQYSAPNDGYSGSFHQPRGVASDQRGRVVVADTGNRRVVTIEGALLLERVYLPLIMKNE